MSEKRKLPEEERRTKQFLDVETLYLVELLGKVHKPREEHTPRRPEAMIITNTLEKARDLGDELLSKHLEKRDADEEERRVWSESEYNGKRYRYPSKFKEKACIRIAEFKFQEEECLSEELWVLRISSAETENQAVVHLVTRDYEVAERTKRKYLKDLGTEEQKKSGLHGEAIYSSHSQLLDKVKWL